MLRVYLAIALGFLGQFAFAQTEPVKLRWVSIPFAASYDVEVESAGTMGRPLLTRNVNLPELALDLPPGTYSYRVRGVATKGKGLWSEKQSFGVKAEPVVLLSPSPDFKVDAGTRISFSWKSTSGYRYRIQIADAKKILSEQEVTEGAFVWTANAPGNYRWRVTYANVSGVPWTEFRAIHVTSPANLAVNTKIERPHAHWTKTLWAGAYMNSFAGDFADSGNNVNASTLSGSYAWEVERKHEHFSPYSEARPSFKIGVDQQSLVKKTSWLPEAAADYTHLWSIKYLKVGPTAGVGYGETGFFTADSQGDYNMGSFWRATYGAGIFGEYLFKKFVLNAFFKVGGASGGTSSLAPGGIKPSSTYEAGLGGRLAENSRWSVQLRLTKEDVKWTSALGNNSLTSTIWSLALGGEL